MNGTTSTITRGALIVLEGCDRAGKTTQGKMVVEALNKIGRPSEFMCFPDRTTEIGKMINGYLKVSSELNDKVIHLLFSANRWEKETKIKTLLNEGKTIVIDRYAYSGVAFSAAKKGMDFDWCRQCDVGLPQPDLVIFFELSSEAAKQRGDFGQERYEEKQFQERVSDNYQKLKDDYWTVVDAGRSIQEVQETVMKLIKDKVTEVENKSIGELWSEDTITNGQNINNVSNKLSDEK